MILSESKMRKLISEVLREAFSISTMSSFQSNIRSSRSGGGDYEDAVSESSEEWAGPVVDSPISTGTSSSVAASAALRAEELGDLLGIDPAWIYAQEAKESSHIPNAMAFNGDNFIRFLGDDEDKVEKALDASFKKSDQAFYGSNAGKAFAAAYEIDKIAAIKAGAWGLYQVLGDFSLGVYGNDPDEWTAAFKADPVQHSRRAFERWINEYGDEFKKAVNDGDYAYTTEKYFGTANSDYEKFIRDHVAKYREDIGPRGGESTEEPAEPTEESDS